ncbi:MAG: sulfur reduction protein DsrE [Omnitrophica WOR_2 bacterium RIFCSPLOWO2_02_FULL_45_28]|nr:MAG: sulfur reduction protein DsrE [Omnitrophica WOR_2 bacterium RIFCSPLOWO2_02_FULL_45_28]
MKTGLIISSNDAETVWSAFRFANFALNNKDTVSVFLIGKGVEYEGLSSEQFNIIEQAEKFLNSGGKIFACGTCLKQRNSSGSNLCPISTMKDMYRIVAESDKILTF